MNKTTRPNTPLKCLLSEDSIFATFDLLFAWKPEMEKSFAVSKLSTSYFGRVFFWIGTQVINN